MKISKKKINRFIKKLIRKVISTINKVLILLPVKKNSAVFESFQGKDINDNPAAIYNKWVEKYPEYKKWAYFTVRKSEYKTFKAMYPDVKMVKKFMPKWVWVMARANFWVFNSRTPKWWKKNSGTVYMQTWHGTPLKKLGVDIENVMMPGTNTERYKRNFTHEAHRWDYLIAPNQYSKDIFARAFDFNNHFLDIGYPRNDVLYTDNNAENISRLKKKYFGRDDIRIITYAPTWRDDDYKRKGVYNFEFQFDLAKFFDNVDDDTMLIIRPHYLVKDLINIEGYEDRVKIMVNEDISDLYLISDLLITDYSSVMFDYANLKRPMLFYAYDLKHYAGDIRGFYFDYRSELPGPVVEKEEDFYKAINQFNKNHKFDEYDDKMDKFYDKYCGWESANSSELFVDEMRKISNGK
ncbi:CDP-glycerol glycerophosphotransferase family protein [Apilactobacillus bombintestini]|uniref:CDP-glycerol glycerophosphotransferase family protein n=1 Tax=Apilactobacillus bombintestini TaxID=2419772 RepID=A0A387APB9_9LACO|nr:CDP-glycerol glycerophosphotransferase family protein [Apilactobacillus bombintestini]AYF92524.1 CDP-glycerol glycerophosphotransferase family protein [Apilactobacillus bombintestini]